MSLNTLRTHTKNIYGKLGVNTRRAAVRRAEELTVVVAQPASINPGLIVVRGASAASSGETAPHVGHHPAVSITARRGCLCLVASGDSPGRNPLGGPCTLPRAAFRSPNHHCNHQMW